MLLERALGTKDASGMALMLTASSSHVDATLYRYEPMVQAMQALIAEQGEVPPRSAWIANPLRDYVVAYINAGAGDGEPSHFVVSQSAALKGWGPFIYDVCMANSPGLAPDRNTVSAQAKKVWEHYYQRSDVAKHPLEGRKLHEVPSLDCAYVLQGPGPDTSAMQQLHQRLAAEVPNGEEWLSLAAQRFFSSRHHGSMHESLQELHRDHKFIARLRRGGLGQLASPGAASAADDWIDAVHLVREERLTASQRSQVRRFASQRWDGVLARFRGDEEAARQTLMNAMDAKFASLGLR
jgi:hypothetical protein